jgi:hypothetical protein
MPAQISGNSISVKDEGVVISPSSREIDFTGAGVTATQSGNTTTVDITSGGGGFSFSSIQTDLGTTPVADSTTDTLTLTSSDLDITGNSTTDTVTINIKPNVITDVEINSANKDGLASVASMRTLGTGAQQAAAGNDARLSDTRTPTDNTVSTVKIQNDAVDNTKLANMATSTFKARVTAGTGDPEDITGTQATTLLDTFTSSLKGLTPASGGGTTNFLRADGTWSAPPDTTGITQLTSDVTAGPGSGSQAATIAANAVTNAKLADMATQTFKGRTTAGTGDPEDLTATQATALLNTVTTSLKGLAPASGGGTANFLRADITWAAPVVSASNSWDGLVIGAYNNGDPYRLLDMATNNGTVAATPTNITTSVARIAYFRPTANITVNKIRYYGVGTVASVYTVAIYNAATLARLTASLTLSTTANTWGSVGSALGVNLVAGTTYFIACSVNTTGTTAGLLCMGPTQAATTGQIAVLPNSYPGNLAANGSAMGAGLAQFAVTAGAMPDPAATIAAQAAWTGGMPAFWLDNNNA